MPESEMLPETFLRRLFARAVEEADPMRVVPRHLPEKGAHRWLVIGAGKASARMAEAVESVWGPCEGIVLTRDGYERHLQGIELISARHPVPDARGEAGTARMLAALEALGPEDRVLALISGGASSLLVAPVEGVSLAQKQAVNAALLASGAPISEMNLVRKHLSRVKGGQLSAAAWPAPVLALMISDVPGDDPAVIGSGPTVGEPQGIAAAREVVERYGLSLAPEVAAALGGASGVLTPQDPRLALTENRVIAAPAQSLAAAAKMAQTLLPGCDVRILGDALEGEARDLAALQAKEALAIRAGMTPGAAPVLLLSGGEVTVTRRGDGSGGPNAEYILAMLLALQGAEGIHALAGDTDGVDGAAEVAGAVIGPGSLAAARAKGLDPEAALARNDAHGFFGTLGAQLVTGPTMTNVNDFRAVLILPPR